MHSYAELAKQQQIDENGLKIPIKEVLNQKIVVLGYEIRKSNMHKPDYLLLKIEYNNEKRVIFTNSEVLCRQCKGLNDEAFPFTTTIVQKNNYFTFT